MQDNFMDSCSLDYGHMSHLRDLGDDSSNEQGLGPMIDEGQKHEAKGTTMMRDFITNAASKKKQKGKNKLVRRITKSKAQKESSYRKNICGYITKKVIREFIYGSYKRTVEDLCESEHADWQATQIFYQGKIECVTGPSHLSYLFVSSKKEDMPSMRVFVRFFQWFLQQRYLRHLIGEGKMEVKKAYIEYKNKCLLPAVSQFEKRLFSEIDGSSTINGQGDLSSIL